jgi:uncharacterized protein (TIGR02266 family)
VDISSRFREYAQLDRQRRVDGLTPAEEHRWRALRRFLSIHFAPDLPESVVEQRDSVRVPTRINVSFTSDQHLVSCMMTIISRGGVFVQTEHPLELGTQFTLQIHVDSPKRDISVPVEVVSVGVGPRYARSKQGMGLRFRDVPPDVEKQLRELYEGAVR